MVGDEAAEARTSRVQARASLGLISLPGREIELQRLFPPRSRNSSSDLARFPIWIPNYDYLVTFLDVPSLRKGTSLA